eukprot:1144194-Pelagomonas_calceolata.AAC.1
MLWSVPGYRRPRVGTQNVQNCVWSVAFNPDGSRLVSASDDKTIGHNSAKTSMINQLDVCARVLIRVGGGNAVKLLTNPILKLTFKCVADL